MQRIALVYMNDSEDNFFIENPPNGKPEKWIDRYVYDISNVENVMVYELGGLVGNWSNPDSSSEEEF
jgi:hypothetical protein